MVFPLGKQDNTPALEGHFVNLSNFEIIDITPVINADLAVFPGDTEFSRKELMSFEKGDNLVLSQISSTAHLGAHTDAPNHYNSKGKGIESRDLSLYLGKAQVITFSLDRGKRIEVSDLENIEIKAERVLVKTNSFPDPYNWNADFNSLSASAIAYLAKENVKLIGIDTPSVDPADDKELKAHNEIYKNDMAILEGIVLKNVEDGVYQLIALPLPIENGDASPVRAILLK